MKANTRNQESNISGNTLLNTETSKSGITFLEDCLCKGIKEGNICLIAGRLNSGREELTNIIRDRNIENGKNVLFISIGNSLNLNNDNKDEYIYHNLFFIEKESLTISELINIVKDYKTKHLIDVLILDYIQQVRLDSKEIPNAKNEISKISADLRTLVKELKLQAYVLSNVSRHCDDRDDNHPTLLDIYGSNILEQDAAYVLTVSKNKETNDLKVSLIKNRFGELCSNYILR